jgi:hypothetical protein
MECNVSHCPACSEHHPTHRFGSGASHDCLRRFSDHGQVHDPGITGKVQQGLAAIHSKERKKVVQDHVEHLIDTQASIIKSAQEYQQKYIRTAAAGPLGTTRHHLWMPTSRTTGSWLLGRVCRWGAAGLRSSDRAGEAHSKSFQWTAFGRQPLCEIQPIYS